jgi:hypothetical protein
MIEGEQRGSSRPDGHIETRDCWFRYGGELTALLNQRSRLFFQPFKFVHFCELCAAFDQQRFERGGVDMVCYDFVGFLV